MRRSSSPALLCLTILASACGAPARSLAAPTQTNASGVPCEASSTGAWSEAKDGLRGRLVATRARDAEGHAQLRLDLELENVSDRAEPLEVAWTNLGSVLELSLEDEHAAPVPRLAVGGNEFTIPTYTLRIPVESTIRIGVSPAAYEYTPAGEKLLRPLTFQAWDVTQVHASKLYLKAKLVPLASVRQPDKSWAGPLELPRVELPSS